MWTSDYENYYLFYHPYLNEPSEDIDKKVQYMKNNDAFSGIIYTVDRNNIELQVDYKKFFSPFEMLDLIGYV